MIVQGRGAVHGDIGPVIVLCRRDASPQDDRVRIGIARGNAMGEVQTRDIIRRAWGLSFGDLVQGNAQRDVTQRRAVVVDIGAKRG